MEKRKIGKKEFSISEASISESLKSVLEDISYNKTEVIKNQEQITTGHQSRYLQLLLLNRSADLLIKKKKRILNKHKLLKLVLSEEKE